MSKDFLYAAYGALRRAAPARRLADAYRFDRADKDDLLVDIDAYALVSAVTGYTIGISVTGTSYSTATLEDIVTLHYAFSSAAGLTTPDVAEYTGGGGSTKQFATGIAASGNEFSDVDVFVCGYSDAPLNNQNVGQNYVTLGYLSRNTSPSWAHVFNRAGQSGNDIARRIDAKADPNGPVAVYVTGTSWGGSGSGSDVVTMAFGRTGDSQWVHEIDTSHDDHVVDMIAVAEGDIYVLTKRFNGSNYDYRTVRIEGLTGIDGWTNPPVYNAPPLGGIDEPLAITAVIDASDTADPVRTPFVYVSGRSLGSIDGTSKYATVKYDQ